MAGCLSFLMLFSILTSCDDDDDNNNKTYSISGSANGTQVVPSVSGNGTGTISGTFNPSTRVLTYTTGWDNLTGIPTSGGFYTGAAGSNGAAIGEPWVFSSTAAGTGTMNGSMTLTESEANSLVGGNWYYTYGTATNPNGEVRGQITATR